MKYGKISYIDSVGSISAPNRGNVLRCLFLADRLL